MQCDGILHMPQMWGPLVKIEKYIVIIVYVLFNTIDTKAVFTY